MKQYKIGDFAKELNVSNSFLKYYESQGILEADITQTGYRYYNLSQASRLIASLKYKSMGFNLKRATKMLKYCSLDEIMEKFSEQEESALHEIARLEAILPAYRLMHEYHSMVERKNSWRIDFDNTFYFLPHTYNKEFIRDDNVRDRVKEWMGELPIVDSALKIGMSNGKISRTPDGEPNFNWGFLCPMEYAQDRLNVTPPVEKVHMPRYIKYYCRMADNETHSTDSYLSWIEKWPMQALNILSEHNFTLDGNIFMHSLMQSFEDGVSHFHAIIYVPVL